MTFLATPFDLASYCTLVELNSGTGAPSTDMRGQTAVGTYREWGPLEYDSTLALKARAVSPFDLASYSALVELNSGTGAPSADLRGTTVQGTYREWGPLEYDATLDISPGTLFLQAVAGTLTSAGVLIKKTKKPLAGTLASAGVVVKSTARALAGAMTSAGAVVKKTGKPLAGAMASAGVVVKKTSRALAGSAASSGTLASVYQAAVSGLISLTARARSFALAARDRN